MRLNHSGFRNILIGVVYGLIGSVCALLLLLFMLSTGAFVEWVYIHYGKKAAIATIFLLTGAVFGFIWSYINRIYDDW